MSKAALFGENFGEFFTFGGNYGIIISLEALWLAYLYHYHMGSVREARTPYANLSKGQI